MTVQSKALKMVHDLDPKKQILDAVSDDIKGFEPTGRDLLIVVYERPDAYAFKGEDGKERKLWLPDNASAKTEDRYQGIVGLVVKRGPRVDEAAANFTTGAVPEVGDWIIAPIANCMSLLLGKRICRLIEAQMVRGVVSTPDLVA